MSEPITLVLVDDHHIVRKGLKRVLEMYADMQVIGEAEVVRKLCSTSRNGCRLWW